MFAAVYTKMAERVALYQRLKAFGEDCLKFESINFIQRKRVEESAETKVEEIGEAMSEKFRDSSHETKTIAQRK